MATWARLEAAVATMQRDAALQAAVAGRTQPELLVPLEELEAARAEATWLRSELAKAAPRAELEAARASLHAKTEEAAKLSEGVERAVAAAVRAAEATEAAQHVAMELAALLAASEHSTVSAPWLDLPEQSQEVRCVYQRVNKGRNDGATEG